MEEKPIIPYSRIIGGDFDKQKADIVDFYKFLQTQAEKLQVKISLVDIKDTKSLAEYAKEVADVTKMKEELEKATKALMTTEKMYNKVVKDARAAENDKFKALADAEVQLSKYKNELKELQKEEAKSPKANKKSAAAIVDLKLRIKDLNTEYNKNQKEILETNKLTAKEQKLLSAYNAIENKRVDTLQEVRDRMSALRLVVQNTNMTTEEGRKTIEKYNKEIDELTKLLSDNSDEFIKNKINIGNYKESVKEALDEIGIFKTEIPFLGAVLDKLIVTLLSTTAATEANTAATAENSSKVSLMAKVQSGISKIFSRNAAVVAANTAAVEVNTIATGVSAEATAVSTVSTVSNTAATNANTLATVRNTASIGRMAKAFRVLGTALKATGIVLLIALLASLFSVFRQGRAGVVATEKAMARFSVFAKVTITTLAEFGKGLFSLFGAIGSSISNGFNKIEKAWLNLQLLLAKSKFWKQNEDEVASLEKQINSLDKTIQENSAKNSKSYEEAYGKMGDAIGKFSGRIEDGNKAIKTMDEGIIRAFEIGDIIKKAELDIIRLNKAVRGLEMMSDDDTLSLNTQLTATNLLLTKRLELLRAESNINKLNLEQANAKARADLQAQAGTIGARATAIAGIKDEAKFTEALLKLNIDLSERKGENPLDDEQLNASVEALKVYRQGLAEIEIAKQENAEKLRKIDRDIFEQNLDLLIDLVDKEKTLSEQQVNSTALNYEKRLAEFDRFRGKFKDNAQKELEEFNKLAIKSAASLRSQLDNGGLSPEQTKLVREELEKLDNLDLSIEFDSNDGFKVLNGDTELAMDNIVELNKQLQKLGLAEIPINRFREFTIETANWLRDTRDQEIALKKVKIAIEQLQSENIYSEEQVRELESIREQLQALSDPTTLSPLKGDYDKRLKEIEELEKRKTKILENGEDERIAIRLKALDEEQKIAEKQAEDQFLIQKRKTDKTAQLTAEDIVNAHKNSEDLLKIDEERLQLLNQLVTNSSNRIAEKQKEQTEKLKEQWERFKKDLFNVFDMIADKFVEMANKQVAAAETRVTKQEKVEDDQRARAQSGLENTLAFEQKELAKREAEAEKARKKAQRLEKIKALYTSYTNYASDPENKNGTAITKTLRDFAILEAVQAAFGDGGLVADKVPTDANGITRGRSHRGNGGGIPVMVEGGEGFLNTREVDNFGEDNFRAFKAMLGKGKFSPNMFRKQQRDFMKVIPMVLDNSGVERGLKEVREEIRNKPTQVVSVEELVSGFIKITEANKTPNKTRRNSFIVKRKKF